MAKRDIVAKRGGSPYVKIAVKVILSLIAALAGVCRKKKKKEEEEKKKEKKEEKKKEKDNEWNEIHLRNKAYQDSQATASIHLHQEHIWWLGTDQKKTRKDKSQTDRQRERERERERERYSRQG